MSDKVIKDKPRRFVVWTCRACTDDPNDHTTSFCTFSTFTSDGSRFHPKCPYSDVCMPDWKDSPVVDIEVEGNND